LLAAANLNFIAFWRFARTSTADRRDNCAIFNCHRRLPKPLSGSDGDRRLSSLPHN